MDSVLLALMTAGMGALWLRHLKPARPRAVVRFDPDAEVAVHVATHEARQRGQLLSSVHLLYGLLQDETITAAITAAGGDPDALEDRVLAALDGTARSPHAPAGVLEEAQRVLGMAAYTAEHAGRRASVVDLWGYLNGTQAATLVDGSGVTRVAVLVALLHGSPAPEVPITAAHVNVVLRNDDFTTQELVCEILQSVFALPEATAKAHMMTTHTEGRAVIGRFSSTDARAKIAEARSMARARGYPLWIGAEPL